MRSARFNKSIALLGFGLSLVISVPPAGATIIFELGNHPTDEENILFNTDQLGNPIRGEVAHSGFFLDFSSTTQTLLKAPSSGQARVESGDIQDGPINNLKMQLEDGAVYQDIILNPFLAKQEDGPAHVTVVDSDGIEWTFDYDLSNGENFLTITAIDGESIVSTTIDAENGFHDLRQPRISGAHAPVPEPIFYQLGALLGLGGLGIMRLRRKKT